MTALGAVFAQPAAAQDVREGRCHAVTRNPTGPKDSFDPSEPGTQKRVHKGGSFLCTDQYCKRYETGDRGKSEPDTGTNHLGFRCVKEPAKGEW